MSSTSKKYVLLICLALALTTLAVFVQVRKHDFIDFDDNLYVTDNSTVQEGLTFKGIKWAFTTTHAYNWHPLVWLSHMLDCRLYGLNPAGHHLTSVFFHIANTVLLFLVFWRMTTRLWPSAFVAALFALHPLHIESVAWVSERKDVLSTFFWLLTMWLYIRYTSRPRFATYLPVMLALALGLIAKQMLVTLPFVLLLMDYWPLQRFTLAPAVTQQKRRGRKSVIRKTSPGPSSTIKAFSNSSFFRCFVEKIPLLMLSAIASLIIFLIQSEATLVKKIPLGYRLGNALVACAKYIGKMFWPLNLGILYQHPQTNLPLWHAFAAGCLLVCISIAVIRFSHNRRWLIVGWLWFIGTLVPVIGLIQVGLQEMADRYTYVPLIGLFIIIAWGAADLAERLKAKFRFSDIALAMGAVVVLSALTVLTWLQLSHWQNSIVLYKHTIAVTTNNDMLHYNLGQLLLEKGEIKETIEHWRQAVSIDPKQPTIHKNLAILLSRQGKIDEAIEHYRQVLKYRPTDTAAHRALNSLLARRKKLRTMESKNPRL
jgi:hypothetical protein